jgi:PAS domain S-box-containing protein
MKKAPKPPNEEARIGALQNLRVLDTSAEVEFDRITKIAAKICETKISLISLVDSNRQWFKSSVGLDATETPRDISFCGHAIMNDEIFMVEDSREDERFRDNPLCVGAPNVIFYAGAPLITKGGHRIGTLCVIDSEPKTLSDDQLDHLKDLSLQVVKLFELRLVEKQFKEISDAAQIGHWSYDLSSKRIEWSDNMYQLFNYDIKNGAPNFEQYQALIHPDDFESVQGAIFNSVETKEPYNINHRVFNKEGEPIWLEGHGEPVINNNGEVIALNGVCQNIDEKMKKNIELQKYQRELKESNTYLSFAVEGAGLGIWDWFLEDNSVQFDEGWAKMFGHTIDEIEFNLKSWESRVHPDDIEAAYKDIQAYMDGKTEFYENIHRTKHRDGRWLYILGRGRFSEWDESGKPTRFTGTNLDITSEKEKELLLIDKSLELKVINNLLSIESDHNLNLHDKLEKSLKMIFDVPWLEFFKKGGLFLTKDDELHLEVSLDLGEKIEKMCKVVKCGQCLCGMAMEKGEVVHASCVDERHENTFEGISAHGHYNVPILGREGKVLGVTVYYLPHGHVRNEKEVSFLKSCSDVLSKIIASHQYELDLITQRDLARIGEKSKTAFLANMSHEIRTPMNGIIGLLELFQTNSLNESQKDLMLTIQNSTDHLLNILNDILDFSKIESDNIILENIPFNLNNVMLDIYKLNNTTAKSKGLDLNLHMNSKEEHYVLGDPVRFRQIIDNFISNAIKFTSLGSIDVSFNLLSEVGKVQTFRIDIKDSGIGLTKKESENLFKAFSQADSTITRKFGGTGLGLSISKKLAEQMGGEILYSSKKGVGSTFSLVIKFQKSFKKIELVSDIVVKKFDSALKVLVVEDNKVNQKILTMMLGKLGLKATTQLNGKKCINHLKDSKINYDVIFMDMQMPEMDGLTCTEIIRAENLSGNPYIIAQTANVFAEDRDRCITSGMNSFIAKPFKQDELYSVLADYVKDQKKLA